LATFAAIPIDQWVNSISNPISSPYDLGAFFEKLRLFFTPGNLGEVRENRNPEIQGRYGKNRGVGFFGGGRFAEALSK